MALRGYSEQRITAILFILVLPFIFKATFITLSDVPLTHKVLKGATVQEMHYHGVRHWENAECLSPTSVNSFWQATDNAID